MNELQREIAALKGGWSQDDIDQRQRAADAQRKHLEARRDAMRAGRWIPSHKCDDCLRAILLCQPELCCVDARENGHGDHWWLIR